MEPMMQLALEEAKLAACEGEIPVGAVLVKDGNVIYRAHNLREQLHDPTAHAEMLCMREGAKLLGDWRLTGCTLYVTLEPCPMCAGAMVMSHLSRCIWAAPDERMGCCGSVYDLPADPALGSSVSWSCGDGREESNRLLKTFFRDKR